MIYSFGHLSLHQYLLGPMNNFVYLLCDSLSHTAWIIDVAWDVPFLLSELTKNNLNPLGVLLTHGHPDHTNGIPEFVDQFPDLPIYISSEELPLFMPKISQLVFFQHEVPLMIGQEPITIIPTPGHSPGSVCITSNDILITGDTLFVEGHGRTDLPGSSAAQLANSLSHISHLSDNLSVFAGHHYGRRKTDTLGVLKEKNKSLRNIIYPK